MCPEWKGCKHIPFIEMFESPVSSACLIETVPWWFLLKDSILEFNIEEKIDCLNRNKIKRIAITEHKAMIA